MKSAIKSILFFIACNHQSSIEIEAFAPTKIPVSQQKRAILQSLSNPQNEGDLSNNVSRREWFKNAASLSSSIAALNIFVDPASASGGATAGGAYLLSAKQRYNARVTEAIKSFLMLSSSIEGGDLAETKAFFEKDEVGTWKDGSAAGYLLANAFRRSSTTPPDSLPSVKKWKAFAAEIEVMQKALKKKDVKGVKASYARAEPLLDAYLDGVELPPVIEMRQ